MKRTTIITPICRASFPHLFKPAPPMKGSDPNKKPQYSITMIFTPADFSPEDKDRFKAMIQLAEETSVAAFKKPVKELGMRYKLFRDGAEKAYDGYGPGKIFVKATSLTRPGVVASDGKTPIQDAEAFYAGCFMRASLTAFTYDFLGNRGVSFGLSNVMFVKSGDRFDFRSNPEDDFSEVSVMDADVETDFGSLV